jgi:hypothetical protein
MFHRMHAGINGEEAERGDVHADKQHIPHVVEEHLD